MSSRLWPEDVVFSPLVLVSRLRTCEVCGAFMHICDHRFHRISTLEAPTLIIAKLIHCSNRLCEARKHTVSPEDESLITMPKWTVGWDVFALIGCWRFAENKCVREIRNDLATRFDIVLSEDAIEDYIRLYETMIAARQQDSAMLSEVYRDKAPIVLTIDGLKPDQDHETLYTVRELTKKRVWFAVTLLSSAKEEIRKLFQRAKQIVDSLQIPVKAFMSDKQDTFLTCCEEVFNGTPHYLCRNHFLRDMAEPISALDSQTATTIKRKVRGLRPIEREMDALLLTLSSDGGASDFAPKPEPTQPPAPHDTQDERTATPHIQPIVPRATDPQSKKDAPCAVPDSHSEMTLEPKSTKIAPDTTVNSNNENQLIALPDAPAQDYPASRDDSLKSIADVPETPVSTASHVHEPPPVPSPTSNPVNTRSRLPPQSNHQDNVEPPWESPRESYATARSLANQATAVQDYCSVVRGILKGARGGPLEPAAHILDVRLYEVHASLQRCIDLKKGGLVSPPSADCAV